MCSPVGQAGLKLTKILLLLLSLKACSPCPVLPRIDTHVGRELKFGRFKFGAYCMEEMAQWEMALAVKPNHLNPIPAFDFLEPICWKKRSDSHNLSSDHQTMAYMPPPPQ